MAAIILISAAVVALILFIPISFRVLLSYNDDGIKSDMLLRYGFVKIKIPHSEKGEKKHGEEKSEEAVQEKQALIKILPGFIFENRSEIKKCLTAVIGRLLTKTVWVDRLYINAELGFDDAMNTGLIYGALSGTVYNIAGLMDRRMRLKKHDITLKPDFNTPHITAELEAVISTNIFNAIVIAVVALIRVLPLYKKLNDRR